MIEFGELHCGEIVCRVFPESRSPVLSFLHFLLVVVSLGCGTLPPSPDADLMTAAVATMGLLTGWAMLCHIASTQLATSVRKGDIDDVAAANYLDVQLKIFGWLGVGVVTCCLAGFQLAPAVVASDVLGRSMAVQAIVFLMPAMAIVSMTASSQWTFMHRIDSRDHGHGGHGEGRFRYLANHLRSGMAWLALPVVVLMLISDVISLLPISTSCASMAIPIASILMVLGGLPMLTRWIFRSGTMSPQRQQWYSSLIRLSGGGRIGVSRWDTGSTSSNALVAGFVPPWRRLWITDRIEDELPSRQIAMIVLHEVGHLRRRHMPIRMLALMPAWAIGLATTNLLGDQAFAEVIGLAFGLAATVIALRWVSHATEYDADAWACRAAVQMAGQIEGVPSTMHDAAETLSAALRWVTLGTDPSKSTWLHPSVDRRIERLIESSKETSMAAV